MRRGKKPTKQTNKYFTFHSNICDWYVGIATNEFFANAFFVNSKFTRPGNPIVFCVDSFFFSVIRFDFMFIIYLSFVRSFVFPYPFVCLFVCSCSLFFHSFSIFLVFAILYRNLRSFSLVISCSLCFYYPFLYAIGKYSLYLLYTLKIRFSFWKMGKNHALFFLSLCFFVGFAAILCMQCTVLVHNEHIQCVHNVQCAFSHQFNCDII